MLKLTLAAALLAASAVSAFASCPKGTSYQCSQGFGTTKIVCGCR